MPELPEVETVVRGLRTPLIGRTVQSMWYDWPRTIHSPSPEEFAARIAGQTFRAVKRRAKYILAELDHDVLIVHLKMTGRLYVTPRDVVHDADRWVHFRLDLDEGLQLRFSDSRKFGKVYLSEAVERITGKLGPEPLGDDFTLAAFQTSAPSPVMLPAWYLILSTAIRSSDQRCIYCGMISPIMPASNRVAYRRPLDMGAMQRAPACGVGSG